MRNAIEAMHDSARKELLVTAKEIDGDMIEVSVADTGAGISEEIADRLFQPFVTTKPAGMGVGLSISKRIIEAHGGKMWVEPNPGGGTVFRFTLQSGRRGGPWRIIRSSISSTMMRRCANRWRSCSARRVLPCVSTTRRPPFWPDCPS